MPATLAEMMRHVNEQVVARREWVEHDDLDALPDLLAGEVQELKEELIIASLTGDVTRVAAEIGDVLHYLLKICQQTGIEPQHALEFKLFRNARKYPDYDLSNGRKINEVQPLLKNEWARAGGDVAFSHLYLDVLAHVEGDEQ